MMFVNRIDAGRQLATTLLNFKSQKDVVVVALPRGGVVIGQQVATRLQAPLTVILVKKIGRRGYQEYALGAIAENTEPVFEDRENIDGIDQEWLGQEIADAKNLLSMRRKLYFKDLDKIDLRDKIVIIVDDGIATGLTMKAAVAAVRKSKPKKLVIAVPVAPWEVVEDLREVVDEIFVLDDNLMRSVGGHYEHFETVSDDDVSRILGEVHAYVC